MKTELHTKFEKHTQEIKHESLKEYNKLQQGP